MPRGGYKTLREFREAMARCRAEGASFKAAWQACHGQVRGQVLRASLEETRAEWERCWHRAPNAFNIRALERLGDLDALRADSDPAA